jgi:hypothetical protein
MSNLMDCRIVQRDEKEFERVVLAELLVPDVPNSWGDLYSREAIKEFCYTFSQKGFGLDVDHNEVDVTGVQFFIVESFIARPGDPDFIEGSWVIGVKILDDDLWAKVLAGEINGFSFQADVFMTPVSIVYESEARVVLGVTEADPLDGHTHTFTVVIGPLNTVLSGGTGITDNHSHPITGASVTGSASGHTHRYQVIGEGADDDYQTN